MKSASSRPLMTSLVLGMIRIYQRTLSFDHGVFAYLFPYGYCKFHPTCSVYMIRVIEKYGLSKGMMMGIWRILRCNPFTRGGVDPVR